MTTSDPGQLVIIFVLNTVFQIIGLLLNGFLGPVFDTLSKPYDSFVHNVLGNLLGVIA